MIVHRLKFLPSEQHNSSYLNPKVLVWLAFLLWYSFLVCYASLRHKMVRYSRAVCKMPASIT